ncbi:hypothetical protein Golomagni_07570 [Golovinomyces magnicellulatus]|nr:hypothetical protein Golomagni_07570 [Golovinomyces magnicellulatus]
MGTGVGVCKDAVGVNGEHLPESEADPLTMNLVRKFLDAEQPDLVLLTGDQLHHDIPDSQSALFKAVAPMIERSIPFAVAFGNHDSEGIHALSRKLRPVNYNAGASKRIQSRRSPRLLCTEQMSILQSLPFSLSQPGPEDVDGIGNYYLQILAHHPPQLPLATLYLLDSHGQIPNNTSSPGPDYSPIQKSQMDWFSSTSQALRDARKKKGDINPFHLTMAFFHIPLPEFGDSTLKMYSGRRREPTEGPKMNSHFFKTLQQENILAVGTGHDHVNDFCALLPKLNDEKALGPWLCQGGSSGFGGYCSYNKKRYPRRMRVWQLNATHGSLETWTRTEHGSDPVDELVLVQNGMVTAQPKCKN